MKYNSLCLLFPKNKTETVLSNIMPLGAILVPFSLPQHSCTLVADWRAKTGWENVLTINTMDSPGHNYAMAVFCHGHPAQLPGTVFHQFKVILKTVQYFNFARAKDLYKSQIYIKIQDLYQSLLHIKSAYVSALSKGLWWFSEECYIKKTIKK